VKRNTLVIRSLRYHAATHAAVAAGVFVATAVLAGALLVGDSMRGSLRANALARLVGVERVIAAPRFFRQDAAPSLTPAIQIAGTLTNPRSGERCNGATVLGVPPAFWQKAGGAAPGDLDDLSVTLNRALADELGVTAGDDVLLRVATPRDVPLETLLGRRDDLTRAVRLRVAAVLENRGVGAFSLTPGTAPARTAFLTLAGLQRALDAPDAANRLLAFHVDAPAAAEGAQWTLADFGLRLRSDAERGYVALESETMLIPPAAEDPAKRVAGAVGADAVRLVSYLANEIAIRDGPAPRSVPYSIVTAVDDRWYEIAGVRMTDGSPARPPSPGAMLLNAWAQDDLQATVDDYVRIRYYLSGDFASLTEVEARFTYAGTLALDPPAADPGFTPEYPGLTDSESVADWDPPFPIDLERVRDRDEEYWDLYRTASKAFIRLEEGVRLWSERDSRFGRFTSIRFYPRAKQPVDALSTRIDAALRAEIDPAALGFSARDVRAEALAAGAGSTDFGGLFIGFSLFLIASAAMLVGLLFRLGALRRAAEIGLLLATGFTRGAVMRLWLLEGLLVATVGCLLGLAGAAAYAWAMLYGLETWWAQAANAPALTLHVQPLSLAIGFLASLLLTVLTIAASVRGLARTPARALLAGAIESRALSAAPPRVTRWIAILAASGALGVAALGAGLDGIARAGAFFGAGALALTALLAAFRLLLAKPPKLPQQPGLSAWLFTGAGNAARNPSRSTLTAALIASASFIVAAISAFHLTGEGNPLDPNSSYGGYSLMIEPTTPVPFDLRTAAGRESAGITGAAAETLAPREIAPFRLRGGAAAGCTNPYAKAEPRILGAVPETIDRGGFTFAQTAAETAAERENPWRLLRRRFEDGAIPVIGDQAAVQWQLHSGLGKTIDVTADDGRPVRLRFVALLANSPLQDELIIAESDFRTHFSSVSGYAFFLLAAPLEDLDEIRRAAESGLADFGADATDLRTRLAAYLAVQNTYLRTFQALGGLGLLLGTIGLAATLLRNVWERRAELGLLRAVGFPDRAIGAIVLTENLLLATGGLAAGLLAALVALAPALLDSAQPVPWRSVALIAVAVPLVAAASSLLAVRSALRAPLLGALRRE